MERHQARHDCNRCAGGPRTAHSTARRGCCSALRYFEINLWARAFGAFSARPREISPREGRVGGSWLDRIGYDPSKHVTITIEHLPPASPHPNVTVYTVVANTAREFRSLSQPSIFKASHRYKLTDLGPIHPSLASPRGGSPSTNNTSSVGAVRAPAQLFSFTLAQPQWKEAVRP
jgi:hypothetical protein